MCKILNYALNAYFANRKADRVVKDFDKANPKLIDIVMLTKMTPHLVQLVLRVDAFNKKAGTPFYAFIKDSEPLCVVIDVQTGKGLILDTSVIASETNAGDSFVINGVKYELYDSKARFKRYKATRVNSKKYTKPRKKLTPLSPEVTNDNSWTDK